MTLVKLALAVILLTVPRIAGASDEKARANDDTPLTIIVPPFDGPAPLGRNVATVLNLQIWQTMRKQPSPNPHHQSFGRGLIQWSPEKLEADTHAAADKYGAEYQDADLILWGKVFPIGDGVLVQCYLTIRHTARTRQLWSAKSRIDGNNFDLPIDLPSRQYEFAPIVLSDNVIAQYSVPAALKMYGNDKKSVVGVTGDDFNAIEQGKEWVRVVSDGKRGWVKLPKLGERSEVVDFVGGLFRALRNDWAGAAELLTRVIDNPDTPNAIRSDALVYRAYSDYARRLFDDGDGDAARARSVSPLSRAATVCRLAGLVSKPLANGAATTERIGLIKSVLAASHAIFSDDDPQLAPLHALAH